MFRSKRLLFFGVILLALGAVAIWSRPGESPPARTSQIQALPQVAPTPAPSEERVTEGEPMNAGPNELSKEDADKLAVVDEILASKNDSDPRLDQMVRDLSPALKAKLRERYHEMAPEDRAGRGLIVFVLGRELKTEEDVAFLTDVLQEPPCLSLDDCSREAPAGAVDEHAASTGNVTLVYPQLVAIKSFERALRDADLKPRALQALEAAERSGHPYVARAARETIERAEESGAL